MTTETQSISPQIRIMMMASMVIVGSLTMFAIAGLYISILAAGYEMAQLTCMISAFVSFIFWAQGSIGRGCLISNTVPWAIGFSSALAVLSASSAILFPPSEIAFFDPHGIPIVAGMVSILGSIFVVYTLWSQKLGLE